MKLNEFAQEVHQNAVEHGWWETPPSFGEIVALCHSELSEALEEHRADRPQLYGIDYVKMERVTDFAQIAEKKLRPEGAAAELCDCVLRILDYLASIGIDVEAVLETKHEYNKTRPYRHGGKLL